MAASIIVPVRLRIDEFTKLDQLVAGDVAGCEGRGELFRLLLHREWNRRRNLGKPLPADWQEAFRTGRPPKE